MDVTAQTDEEIVRALAAGDRAALAQVFDRHAAAMTRYVWAIVDDRHDVPHGRVRAVPVVAPGATEQEPSCGQRDGEDPQ